MLWGSLNPMTQLRHVKQKQISELHPLGASHQNVVHDSRAIWQGVNPVYGLALLVQHP